MRRYNLFYFIGEALKSLKRNGVMTFASIAVLLSCLLVIGGFSLLGLNIDENLENQMEKVLEIVVLGRAARNGSSRKNRQPLNTMYVKLDGEVEDSYVDIIKDELNIKNVDFTGEVDNFVTYTFKPQLKTLGPKYDAKLGKIRKFFEVCAAESLMVIFIQPPADTGADDEIGKAVELLDGDVQF